MLIIHPHSLHLSFSYLSQVPHISMRSCPIRFRSVQIVFSICMIKRAGEILPLPINVVYAYGQSDLLPSREPYNRLLWLSQRDYQIDV